MKRNILTRKKINQFSKLVPILSLVFIISFEVLFFLPLTSLNNDNSELTLKTNDQKNYSLINKQYNIFLSKILYDIYVDVLPEGNNVLITAQYTYQNNGNNPISEITVIVDIVTILTVSRISTIIVYDAYGYLNYKWEIASNIHLINVTSRQPINPRQLYTFTIVYLFENAILINPAALEKFTFQWTLIHDEDVEQFSLIVNLPVEFILYNTTSLNPEPNYVSIDGRRFEWNYYEVKAFQPQSWILKFGQYQQESSNVFIVKKNLWFGLIGTFLLGLILGFLGTYFILKSKTDIERKEIVETLLTKPEKEIIQIIKNENNVTTQNRICTISGFSKAKVSYYLAELENKGIVLRERWGRMNRVRITDESVDKVYFDNVNEDSNK